MTYCLGIILRSGLVMGSDSRTNAGVDYISTYRKFFDFSNPGERVLLLCCSGNLSVTQAVLALVERDLKTGDATNVHGLPSLYDVARYIGSKIRQIRNEDRQYLQEDGIDDSCNMLLGGQIRGQETQLYLIYSQGNCIRATPETPFLQIGEAKYGKPILDRTLNFEMPLDATAKCALLSLDSTMRSNISVGPPIHLAMYETDSLQLRHHLSLRLGDPYLAQVRKQWEAALKQAFESMPALEWELPPASPYENVEID